MRYSNESTKYFGRIVVKINDFFETNLSRLDINSFEDYNRF